MKNVASVSYSPFSHSEETEIYGGSLRVGVRQLIETLLHPLPYVGLGDVIFVEESGN